MGSVRIRVSKKWERVKEEKRRRETKTGCELRNKKIQTYCIISMMYV